MSKNPVFRNLKNNRGGSHNTHLARANKKIKEAKEVAKDLDRYIEEEVIQRREGDGE